MKFLAVITLLILAITLAQPVAAQSFKPDYEVGDAAYDRKDYATALKHLRPLAEQGHARAQYRLGDIYSGGWGVTEDDAEAVRWYRKAAEQGHAKAQFWLGIMYYQGHGVTRDYKEAVRWCRKAAKQGDAYAQFWLGDMYKQGIGDLQDDIMAYVWYHVAGANGHGLGVKNCDNIEKKGSTSPTFARPESCRGLASRSQQAAPNIAMTKPMTRPALASRPRLHITRDAI